MTLLDFKHVLRPDKKKKMAAPSNVDAAENRKKMEAGELYYAFTPDLIKQRQMCKQASKLYNESDGLSRREQIELYQE